MTFSAPPEDLDLISAHFPGGSLYSALYDREVMRLSDRGGASGLIGSRWADLCDQALNFHQESIGGAGRNGLDARPLAIDRVIRLDDIPAVAAQASRLKLQNPDFLLIRELDGHRQLLAADAKFSVETAKSRQVSSEVVSSLIAMGPLVSRLLPSLEDVTINNGVFLCPDYSLTRRLLRSRRGMQRVTVSDDEVRLIPVTAEEFLCPLDHGGLIDLFATVNSLPVDHRQSLALSLYYFRLARSAIGCWIDQTSPLLMHNDRPVVNVPEITSAAVQFARSSSDAWLAIVRWNELAEQTRLQRMEIDQVTALPISGKELRTRIEQAARAAATVPPSTNRVRRVLGAWFREQFRNEFGPVNPPVADFDVLLTHLATFGRSLRSRLEVLTDEVILDFVSTPEIEKIAAGRVSRE